MSVHLYYPCPPAEAQPASPFRALECLASNCALSLPASQPVKTMRQRPAGLETMPPHPQRRLTP